MRKLIKLDKIYDIKFDSKIHSFETNILSCSGLKGCKGIKK